MPQITDRYIEELADIYRDILAAFPQVDPSRKAGYGLAFQSLYSALEGKYTLGQIQAACEQMAQGDAMEIKNGIFAQPTELGEEIIEKLTGQTVQAEQVPPFTPPR